MTTVGYLTAETVKSFRRLSENEIFFPGSSLRPRFQPVGLPGRRVELTGRRVDPIRLREKIAILGQPPRVARA